ncbi:MAG: hypothetical protein NW205_11140 [Hyphomicrobiaceae bacterium]|nr:hypothetical protein [Hyphomicrobiaceae bacterium]
MKVRTWAPLLAVALATIPAAPAAIAVDAVEAPSPFAQLHGWWSGEGRLGFRDGKREPVRCRATYRRGATDNDLDQSIRCATPAGKVEVIGQVSVIDGKLKGTWRETVHELSGDMTGEVTERGFRVVVASEGLQARMEIVTVGAQQVVEIQFDTSVLVGLTLVLKKGEAS